MKKTFIIILISICCASASAAGKKTWHRITYAQGLALAEASFTYEQKNLPSFGIDKNDFNPRTSRFMSFTAWSSVGEGTVGNREIDPYTGDVFDGGSYPGEIENKKLKALQRRIRRSLHLTPAEYRKIKTEGPLSNPPFPK